MKISVLGAGAIGSMLGGLIQRHAPHWNVVLIVRGEHGRRICAQGTLKLDGSWGRYDVPVRASDDVADIAGSDFVLVTVKSQDLEAALASAAPHLTGATVVSIQNGINDETLQCYVEPHRLVMGMTATNMVILEPGSVSLQLSGVTVVGPSPDGANAAAVQPVAELLRATGLPVVEHPNVLGVRYNKLAINALGYASCISNSNLITEAICCRQWREAVGRPVVEECIEVFRQAKIELSKIPGRPDAGGLRRFLRLLDKPVLGPAIAVVARRMYNKKPILFSLSQDLLRNKTTEVDYINGQIVRLAELGGLAAPSNALVVELVHELEGGNVSRFMSREEVIHRFKQRHSPATKNASGV